jgi:hypothetical protein
VGVPQAVATAFQAAETTVVALESHVKGTLASFAEQRDYLFRSRRKKVESLAEKLESGRYAAWSDLDDLFACTIVVPTASHEDGVIEFLDAVFDPVDIRDETQPRSRRMSSASTRLGTSVVCASRSALP